jgi:hypothetical protein
VISIAILSQTLFMLLIYYQILDSIAVRDLRKLGIQNQDLEILELKSLGLYY